MAKEDNDNDEANEARRSRGWTIRACLASATFLLVCLQGTLLSTVHRRVARSSTTGFDGLYDDYANGIPYLDDGDNDDGASGRGPARRGNNNVLRETVEALFMGNESAAAAYLIDNPTLDYFKFYARDLPPGVRSADDVSECLEEWGYNSERYAYPTRGGFMENCCDWSKIVCNPTNHTRATPYSTARLNSNMDAVIARLLTNYRGALRTFKETEATVKVVPFPDGSNVRCNLLKRRGDSDRSHQILLDTNQTKLTDHLFLFLEEAKLLVHKWGDARPGKLVIPYVNTNAEYQPQRLISSMSPRELDDFFAKKSYALAAVFSAKISGAGGYREAFAERADSFFGNGTLDGKNGTLGGMPVEINIIQEKREMVWEAHTMQLYRDSVFCPSFRGDLPAQKRFFDAILSGCIPVVMAHRRAKNRRTGEYEPCETSYFSPGAPLSMVYPWARGSFGERHPDMGVDYSQLVVEIDAVDCGVDCIPKTLEKLMEDPVALRQKQYSLARYARLFSYGMGDDALRPVDAMSALLVRARHFVVHEAPRPTPPRREVSQSRRREPAETDDR
eukprot:CAMPEP_0172574100 /NCGR_PEP_ID=MMETSP1067-20121228/136531_1 /TAXON_ID=265564 ORGANISM="Thalassiosira punctigera, Strain Tpunct2005C2" /NCGR_SAMPLE_ID=MMETSP1067 /ASSEMBLY_ACC=CAM_ASM_000444 /LENGTH=560 /DNA_ID=CAMNT_0013366723 /DNA_START=93 /DNA_END=1775 /DNA_ORIENTATION=+